jgi:DNA-binding transcriptional LysR family regulator
MELRQLRYFIAVAEELNFTRAAERLGISTPSLSQQVRELERSLGVQLFFRNKRTVRLTDAGTIFLDEARLTLQQAERAELVARQTARGEVGQINIGYVSSAACSGTVSEVAARFRALHPRVELRLHKLEGARQLASLADGTIDLGFLSSRPPYPDGIAGLIISRSSVSAALHAGHPLARLREIPASALRQEQFVMPAYTGEDALYPTLAAVAEHGNFVPKVVQHTQDFFTAIALVAAGFGVSIVPASCRCLQLPGVAYVDVDLPTESAVLAAVYRKDERSAAARTLVAELRGRSGKAGIPGKVFN